MNSAHPRSSAAGRDYLTGQLLIAMPNMGDPRFEHAVIFLCAHDDEHAMGVIVNKPLADVELSELLTQLEIKQRSDGDNPPVFFGGPVQTERGVILHTLDYRTSSTIELTSEIGLTATKEMLEDIAGGKADAPSPRKFIFAIGHAGWGPGQLEQEIAMNVWAHCEPDEELIFDGAKIPSWKRALEKLGVTGAMFSPEWSNPRGDDKPLN